MERWRSTSGQRGGGGVTLLWEHRSDTVVALRNRNEQASLEENPLGADASEEARRVQRLITDLSTRGKLSGTFRVIRVSPTVSVGFSRSQTISPSVQKALFIPALLGLPRGALKTFLNYLDEGKKRKKKVDYAARRAMASLD